LNFKEEVNKRCVFIVGYIIITFKAILRAN